MAGGIDFDKLFPGRFLKAGEFGGKDVTLTISAVTVTEMEGEKGGVETKGIVSFKETKRQLALNKTNGLCIKAMFGRDTASWVGRRVTFFPDTINFQGHDICIRVRGSPDLDKPVTFKLHLQRKAAREVTMAKTTKSAARVSAEPQPAAPTPAEPSAEEKAAILAEEAA